MFHLNLALFVKRISFRQEGQGSNRSKRYVHPNFLGLPSSWWGHGTLQPVQRTAEKFQLTLRMVFYKHISSRLFLLPIFYYSYSILFLYNNRLYFVPICNVIRCTRVLMVQRPELSLSFSALVYLTTTHMEHILLIITHCAF